MRDLRDRIPTVLEAAGVGVFALMAFEGE